MAAGGTGGPVVHNVPFVSFPSDPEQTNIKQQHSLSTYDELLHALLSSLHHKDQKRQAPNPPSGQPGSNVPSSNSSNGNKGQFDDGFGSCSKEGELFFKGSPLPWWCVCHPVGLSILSFQTPESELLFLLLPELVALMEQTAAPNTAAAPWPC